MARVAALIHSIPLLLTRLRILTTSCRSPTLAGSAALLLARMAAFSLRRLTVIRFTASIWAGVALLVAGAGGAACGGCGDGGPAILARFNQPTGLALGPDGSLYVAEEAAHRIRRVAPDGMISTVAGSGQGCPFPYNACFDGDDGLATRKRGSPFPMPWRLGRTAACTLPILLTIASAAEMRACFYSYRCRRRIDKWLGRGKPCYKHSHRTSARDCCCARWDAVDPDRNFD